MKTVYETLPPTLQKRYDEIHRKAMDNELRDGGVYWKNPQASITATTSNPTFSNAPLYWGCEGRLAMFKKCQNKIVIDIGVNANGACVTFDDSSMLEIKPSNDAANLIERTGLNLLNGTRLDDIVVVPHHSLVSNWVGNLLLYGKNGAQVIFKIISPTSSTNFNFDLKDLNAVR